ncbi:hypothetical protein [Companilactobacillus kimchii]|uniref:Uncharacterized protein n=2 Tax=Companilactobacillus kimchii TaxID=2801452 RepID=A0ABR5NWF1_9LACO|nr:hypothetical protein [Companilactobacillus kimchii]KAE9561321.1 hypothetical protein ATN91_07745 [Companilactobacillus kimchii]KRK53096.1 hypothetical protein FC97_GL001560 [Companilactobacillus kimchii DSM 13961 = JCM 10707]OWF32855.1 hypothetical protein LKACC12383_01728 [Companilactobacillus kimchii]GEO48411.1 hypothetical protein LKI01_24100 [Companilactobacillus paralimentarius]
MSYISNFINNYHNLISLIASLATIIIAFLAYQTSKKTYNNSLPNLIFNDKTPTIISNNGHNYFQFKTTLLNDGKGTIMWGLVFLKIKNKKNIYISQPIFNLKEKQTVEITIHDALNNIIDRNSIRPDKSITSFIYYKDSFNNKFYIDLLKKDPELINFYNTQRRLTLLKSIKIKIMIRQSKKYKKDYVSLTDIELNSKPIIQGPLPGHFAQDILMDRAGNPIFLNRVDIYKKNSVK